MIRRLNIITPANGGPSLTVAPEDKPTFDAVEPYGYKQDAADCILVNGRWYPLREGTPAEGLAEWDAAEVEAREVALDDAIAAMPPAAKQRFGVERHRPYAVRKARRALDDAIADKRAAKGADERAAATLVVQAARAALDAAKDAAGIVEPEPDEK